MNYQIFIYLDFYKAFLIHTHYQCGIEAHETWQFLLSVILVFYFICLWLSKHGESFGKILLKLEFIDFMDIVQGFLAKWGEMQNLVSMLPKYKKKEERNWQV